MREGSFKRLYLLSRHWRVTDHVSELALFRHDAVPLPLLLRSMQDY